MTGGWNLQISSVDGSLSLFCFNAACASSLFWDEEDEVKKLLAKQHRLHIFEFPHQMRSLFLQMVKDDGNIAAFITLRSAL